MFIPDQDEAAGMDVATLNMILAGLSISAGLAAMAASRKKKSVGSGKNGQTASLLPGFGAERFVNEDGVWLPKRLSESLWLPDSKIVQPELVLLGNN